jgi:hypothetical protein
MSNEVKVEVIKDAAMVEATVGGEGAGSVHIKSKSGVEVVCSKFMLKYLSHDSITRMVSLYQDMEKVHAELELQRSKVPQVSQHLKEVLSNIQGDYHCKMCNREICREDVLECERFCHAKWTELQSIKEELLREFRLNLPY